MRLSSALASLVLILAACADASSDVEVSVVATTSIAGDVVANVVGEEASVEVLMPLGSDPHEFQASSAQVAEMASADLIVAIGLGLEEGLAPVFDSLSADGIPVFEVAPLLDPIGLASTHDHVAADQTEHALDPHVWMDPLRMATAAERIGGELERLHPGGGWEQRAAAYAAQLRTTDAEIESLLGQVPVDHRLLITNHTTMGYFAHRYRWEVLQTVIPGGSTTGAPSSAHLAELVGLIEANDLPAIFTDWTRNDSIARAVAVEVDHPVAIVPLHTESLTDGGEAPTLIELLLFNARVIAGALAG